MSQVIVSSRGCSIKLLHHHGCPRLSSLISLFEGIAVKVMQGGSWPEHTRLPSMAGAHCTSISSVT